MSKASDWDIFGTVESGDEQGDQNNDDNDGNDGVFFGDGGVDNDSFGTPSSSGPSNVNKNNDNEDYNSGYSKFMGNEAQSFNPRMLDHSKHHDFFDQGNADFDNEKAAIQTQKAQNDNQQHPSRPYHPPQAQSNYYDNMPNSYTCIKIYNSPENADYKSSKRRGRPRGPRGGNRMYSDSDSSKSFTISTQLLEDGFDEKVYMDFHDAALQQRAELGIGKSSEMKGLYYFWCYYLRTNFDQSMYDEFLDIAKQDASANYHYGIECYFRLCSYGLEKRWDPQVFAQFQDEALADYKNGSTYGLEKVKGFLDNQKYDFEIKPTPQMEDALSKFPTYESFKQGGGNTNPNGHKDRTRKLQFEDSRATEARSIPKQRFLDSNMNQDGSSFHPSNSPNNNNRQRPGSNRRGGGANNSHNGFNRHRGGNQNRNRQFRHKNDEPREWVFGRMQPSSAPKPDNMNLHH